MEKDFKRERRDGILFCLAAALLWSCSGLFTRLMQIPTFLGTHDPSLSPMQIAFFRAFFAGALLLPFLRRQDMRFRKPMVGMVACFAIMNVLFLSSVVLGSSANAIFLQYMAPFIVYLVGVHVLGEARDPQTWKGILISMIGVAVIVLSGLGDADAQTGRVTLMAVGSGFCYAMVILFLRFLNAESSLWLTCINQLGSATCMATAVFILHGGAVLQEWLTMPTARQYAFLAVFGGLQMGLSYFCFARGLKLLTPSEAGFITLLEPILNPLWVYLAFGETNPWTTWLGGAFIIFALGWRYTR
jgi:drug/metabolite transporter, DME family